jgi:hypothetical protein
MSAQTVANLERQPGEPSLRPRVWAGLALALLAWNSLLAAFASPQVILHHYDGVQYQLLARNRLLGHTEIGDRFHTVHAEGRHPMWRPGLVWIEEGLARCLGSVRAGAAAASAIGTTLLQLALLWLAYQCFGRKTFFLVLVCLPAPMVSTHFLTLAVGQGPEVWSAAAVVAGLGVLALGLARRSWAWALQAGALAGLSEWFRTGNVAVFTIPCAVYGLAALLRRDWRGMVLPASALASFVAVAGVGGLFAPSALNKTVANLWASLLEKEGPFVKGTMPDGTEGFHSLAGYRLDPESQGPAPTWLWKLSVRTSRNATCCKNALITPRQACRNTGSLTPRPKRLPSFVWTGRPMRRRANSGVGKRHGPCCLPVAR